MRRWVKCEKIDVEVTCLPFARQILAKLTNTLLVLAMDDSTLGRICILFVIAQGKTALIDRVDKSLFRLGLDWLKYVLKRGLPLDVCFLFQLDQLIELVRQQKEEEGLVTRQTSVSGFATSLLSIP